MLSLAEDVLHAKRPVSLYRGRDLPPPPPPPVLDRRDPPSLSMHSRHSKYITSVRRLRTVTPTRLSMLLA